MLNILSLFDGISCGKVALDRAGVPVKNYFASEVDRYAIQVSKKNHPDIKYQLGDVQDWQSWWAFNQATDMVIGGPPCQDFSVAGKMEGLGGKRGNMTNVFLDIIDHIKPRWFLMEQVELKGKKRWVQDYISKRLGVQPMMIDAALVSAQSRKRLYWFNWEAPTPEDQGILLKDVAEGDVATSKSQTILSTIYKENAKSMLKRGKKGLLVYQRGRGKNAGGLRSGNGKTPTITSSSFEQNNFLTDGDDYRKFTPVEVERLFTLPDNYTEGISDTQRYRCLGNGWVVDVIAHILKHLPRG